MTRTGKQTASQVDDTITAAADVIANALAEREAEILSVTDRQDALAPSTRKHHRRYQAHWMNWCRRKKYHDEKVMYPKFLVYVRELVAEETVLEDDDYHSIKPIRVNVTNNHDGELPSPETIDAYIKSVIDLHGQQRATAGHSASQERVSLRTPEIMGIVKKYKLRYHEWKKDQEVPRLTVDATYELEELKQMLKASWTRNYRHQNGNRISLAWNYYMTSGETVRTALSSYLYPHEFASRANGRQFALCVALLIAQDKSNQNHELYSCFVRNKDVEICPVGCLAFYLLELWMSPQSEHLIQGSSKTEAMAVSTLYRSQKDAMLSINHRSSKVTHGGRKAGAQHAHANGTSIEDIAHHDNWNHHRLVTHYLAQVRKEVPYRMAGFLLPNEEFWLERNTVLPSKELQKMVFPFVEELFPGNQDWARWIENIMDDNPEEFNRARASRVNYSLESYPAMRLMIILAHLRKVILQECCHSAKYVRRSIVHVWSVWWIHPTFHEFDGCFAASPKFSKNTNRHCETKS